MGTTRQLWNQVYVNDGEKANEEIWLDQTYVSNETAEGGFGDACKEV